MADANIRAVITAKDDASKTLDGFGKKVNEVGSLAKDALIGAGVAAIAFGVLSVKAFSDSEDKIAQTNAVLKSTGSIAGVTARQVDTLSKALEHQTKFSDEDVRSAENLLLTFTSIGKNIFPQATSVVLDMATALNEDLKSASIQVGKALQDPINGITALRRVGVNFNDSQKEVIKNLVDTGQQAKAQQLILAELNREFGGSAKAAGDTFAGSLAKLKNSFNDLEETIGQTIVKAIQPFIDKLTEVATKINWGKELDIAKQHINDFKNDVILLAGALGGNATEVQDNQTQFLGLVRVLGSLNKTAQDAWRTIDSLWQKFINSTPIVIVTQFFQQVLVPVLNSIKDVIKNNLKPAFDDLLGSFEKLWKAMNPAFTDFLKILGTVFIVGVVAMIFIWVEAWNILIRSFFRVVEVISGVINWVANLISSVGNAAGAVWNAVKTIANIFSNLVPATKDAIGLVVGIFASLGVTILKAVWNFDKLLFNAGSDLIGGLVNGIKSAVGDIASAIGHGVSGALHAAHIPGFASGVTNFSGGLAVVGEQGPELVNLPKGSSVTPNSQIGGMGSVNITVQAGAFMGNPQDARQYAKLILSSLQDVAESKSLSLNDLFNHGSVRSL